MTNKRNKLVLLLSILTALFIFASTPVFAAPKLRVTTTGVKTALNNHTLKIDIANKRQRFTIKSKEIKNIRIISQKTSGNYSKVRVFAYINRTVAMVRGDYTINYKYTNGKWKCTSVSQNSARLSAIYLKGVWKGYYVAGQGKTRLVLRITNVDADGFASGIFNFSAAPTNPTVPSGSYTVVGGYDLATGEVVFYGDEWIVRPTRYSFAQINGYVDVYNKKIRDSRYTCSLSKG